MLSPGAAIAVGEREEWNDGNGITVVERLAPRLALFRTSGYLSDELEYFGRSRNGAILDELLAGGAPPAFLGFYDWSGMSGYSTGARSASTSFIMARRKQFAQVCILFKSPVVALGINVANIIVGGFMKATTSREEFDARLKQALESSAAVTVAETRPEASLN